MEQIGFDNGRGAAAALAREGDVNGGGQQGQDSEHYVDHNGLRGIGKAHGNTAHECGKSRQPGKRIAERGGGWDRIAAVPYCIESKIEKPKSQPKGWPPQRFEKRG